MTRLAYLKAPVTQMHFARCMFLPKWREFLLSPPRRWHLLVSSNLYVRESSNLPILWSSIAQVTQYQRNNSYLGKAGHAMWTYNGLGLHQHHRKACSPRLTM